MSESSTTFNIIGKPLDRVDGHRKVTGQARYAAEIQLPGVVYGVVIQSTIAKGRIKSIDASAAERLPGVIGIFTCANKLETLSKKAKEAAEHLFLLQDDVIRYGGQIIGLVVADTLETAKHAASLVSVAYQRKPFNTNFQDSLKRVTLPSHEADVKRGSVAGGLAKAAVRIEQTYTTPAESHNPMEPFSTIAVWEGDVLTLYDSTQGVFQTQRTVAKIFGMAPAKVRVISHFVGGGFGCKLSVWPHVVLAAMAARKLNRPVKVALDRHQMYGPVGFRPGTVQHVTLGATREGKITAIRHQGFSETATFKEYVESVAAGSRITYACDNVETSHRLVRLDIGQPTWMRAPGHATGSFALESALDEMAYRLNLDPIELRLRNFAERDPESGLPWSSNSLKECYKQGAERFGWHERDAKVRSMRDGELLVGWGMATALHTCWRNPASARVKLLEDGTALVESGSQDIGTGTYTIMTQIAAERLSLPVERVNFELGDTLMPETPLSGGSTTAGSVGPAVAKASSAAIRELMRVAIADENSPLNGAKIDDLIAENGRLYKREDRSCSEPYQSIIKRTKSRVIEATFDNKPGDEEKKYSMSAFGAQFAEVKIDPELGTIKVSRFVGVYDGGRILNAKTARSQLLGGITFGIGMALMECTTIDHNIGRIINADLAEYHVPVHADIGMIEPLFVEAADDHINVLGAKGIGELGITGVAAAIANAVYHATGKRVRDLPVTLDKLL